jgi:hypothetical protein
MHGSEEWMRNATGARSRLNGCRTPAEVARESRDRSVCPPLWPDCVRGRSGLRASPCPRCARDGLHGP